AGRGKLERVGRGRAFVIGHRGPGELVGEAALAGLAAASEHVVVIDEAEAVSFPVAGLRRLLGSDAALQLAVTKVLVARQLEAETRLTSLLLRGVEARLIEFLTAAVGRWGEPHAAGQVISAPFTHADIALLIGSTRETVTLLLGRLKRAGLIDFERRRIVIQDAAGLGRRGEET
ncbi:MAG TPA: Crp/Fnr family transcriptional regulator, partial [Candidatus Nanopelagicales bacterium]|nr:Crp/Fnr family transcriptional regulator [Candidatus Nanopelagicales bacterium]